MSGAEVIAGRFAIVRPLARGNMGQVYEAVDERTGGKAAVKTMLRRRNGELVSFREADKNALRFQREVRIMSRLDSDNLPRIIDGVIGNDLHRPLQSLRRQAETLRVTRSSGG